MMVENEILSEMTTTQYELHFKYSNIYTEREKNSFTYSASVMQLLMPRGVVPYITYYNIFLFYHEKSPKNHRMCLILLLYSLYSSVTVTKIMYLKIKFFIT